MTNAMRTESPPQPSPPHSGGEAAPAELAPLAGAAPCYFCGSPVLCDFCKPPACCDGDVYDVDADYREAAQASGVSVRDIVRRGW